jgi:peptidoglycan/xylan/chitin deacetylase (PgdA/CDA1 family)
VGALVVAVGLLRPASARAAHAQSELAPIHRVETAEPAVAVTFDACATRTQGYGFDRKVYEILKAGHVPATLFVSGHWVELHPAEMAELARDPLITFGDHSYDHPHMSRLPAARVGEEIGRTEAALARYGKKSVAFRPPFGDWNRRLIEVVHERGLPTVTWDVVSGDPSARTTKAGMVRNVVDHARAGSIVIFHINGRGWRTAEALPEILSVLRARGLRFVSLADLLALAPVPAPALASRAPASSPMPVSPTPLPVPNASPARSQEIR